MLTEKETLVLKSIKKYINTYHISPTIRELCSILGYKSTKTIHHYIKQLKNKGYLTTNLQKSRSIALNMVNNSTITVINTKKTISLLNDSQLVYQIKNDYFNDYFIQKNDYLIINTQLAIRNNELGLFIINNQYRIMHYCYRNGFYILNDKDQEILYKINYVGKVDGIIRQKYEKKR